MRRIAMCSIAAAAVVAVPAQAKPVKPPKPAKPAVAQGNPVKPAAKCTPRAVGFNARGILVSSTLQQTGGTSTTDERGDDRYSGTLTVNVVKANHRAPKGMQTYTVADVRVKFLDADGDGTADAPKSGDRVKVGGKITRLSKKCDQSSFTPAVTVRKVQFKQAKAPEPAPAPSA